MLEVTILLKDLEELENDTGGYIFTFNGQWKITKHRSFTFKVRENVFVISNYMSLRIIEDIKIKIV